MTIALGDLLDSEDCINRLVEKGLRRETARPKAKLLAQIARAALSQGDEGVVFWVPGRIEVLGKHTDYVGGSSLLSATGHGFFFLGLPDQDSEVRITDVVSGQDLSFQIGPELTPEPGHWGNYPQTVARRLARNFQGPLKGARIFFGSDLPQAAGMSSSSAMIVGFYLLLARINELELMPEYGENINGITDLAGYLGTIENGQTFGALQGDKGVGTFGGSEDHTAILCCRPGTLSQYAYCPVRFERTVDLPQGYTFAIAASGVAAEKTGEAMEKYNRASRLASVGVGAWNEAMGLQDLHLAAALSRGAPEEIRAVLGSRSDLPFAPQDLVDRFDHFYAENEEILPGAGDALAAGDLETFGAFVDRSQALGVQLLKNQVPETAFLAQKARSLGAVAASAFGAGFGGSVWALIETRTANEMLLDWRAAYRDAFPEPARSARFFVTDSGPAAFEL